MKKNAEMHVLQKIENEKMSSKITGKLTFKVVWMTPWRKKALKYSSDVLHLNSSLQHVANQTRNVAL